jgi:hypothetical protein
MVLAMESLDSYHPDITRRTFMKPSLLRSALTVLEQPPAAVAARFEPPAADLPERSCPGGAAT